MKNCLLKKLLVTTGSFLLTIVAFAQTETVYYYYQGKKIIARLDYNQLVAGIKQEPVYKKFNSITTLAEDLQLNRQQLKRTSTASQYIINIEKDSLKAKKLTVAAGQKAFISYIRPCITGPGGKLASYGEEFVVKLKTGIPFTRLKQLLTKYRCAIKRKSTGDINTYLISAGKYNNYDALTMANLFFETGLFIFSQPDFTSYNNLADAPSDPLYPLQWAHRNEGTPQQHNGTPGADIQADSAWLVTMGNSNIKIAVLDTGVDTAQADLKNNLLQGYDCTTQTSNEGDGSPKNMQTAHGTACAGIIASEANNNIGTAGIAPLCKIIPINLTNEFNIFASEFDIASGIDYAWQHGADVLSNSWDLSLPSAVIDDAIHRAVTLGRSGKGAAVFFATGNENSGISYPSSNPEVIAVGGTNMCNQRKSPSSCDGEFWWGANYGIGLDVVAPCIDIATADNTGEYGYNKTAGTNGDYYNLFGGTSSASPHAAAVAALILSVDADYSATEVRTIIETTCTKAGNYDYKLTAANINGSWNNEMGYGRINAYKAVLAAQENKFCNVSIKSPAATRLCKNSAVTLEVNEPTAATYTWYRDGNNFGPGNSISVTEAGVYSLTAEFTNGCTAAAVPVTILAADTLLKADAGKEVLICQGAQNIIIGGEPAATGGTPFTSSKRGYGYDILLGNIIKFNLDNPRDYETIPFVPSPVVVDNDFRAGDFTPYGYYALTRSGNLFRLDTATGEATHIALLVTENIATAGHEWSGLSWDPVAKKLYALSAGGTINKLYEVNPFNGNSVAGTRISNISWIDFSDNGNLYGFYTNLRYLSKINKITGEVNSISDAIGMSSTQYLDGAIDPLDGKGYMSTSVFFNGKLTQDLYIIDTITRKSFVQGHIGSLNNVSSLAITGGTYLYNWSPAEGLSATNIANPVANPTAATNYTLTVTDACGQTATSTVEVNPVTALPAINITAVKDSICVGETVRLSATADSNYNYQWYLNDIGIPAAGDSFYTAQRMGNFQVKVTTAHNGCEGVSNVFTVRDCSVWLNNDLPDTTCYAYFYPSHGYGQNYLPGESYVKTIYPTRTGDLLKLRFNSFNMQNFKDTLIVYNGADTTAPLLGQFKVNTPPSKNIVYYAATGPLTFQLKTSEESTSTGTWEAFIECFTPKVYRSRSSGVFESSSTWEVKTETGSYTFTSTAPQYLDDSIIIQGGHTITLTQNVSVNIDQLWLQKDAQFIINGNLGISNGAGTDFRSDGIISVGPFATINGSNGAIMELNGNIYGNNFYLYMPCFVNGTAQQTFQFDNAFFRSLHLLNSSDVITNGFLRTDSLYMNTSGKLLIDSAEISYLVRLDNGIIDVRNNGIIKPSSIMRLASEGGNANSYINGPLILPVRLAGNYELNFPIGKNGYYKPLKLTIDQHTFPYDNQYRAEVFNSAPFPFPMPDGINNVSTNRYYKITVAKQSPSTSASITLPYDADDGVGDPSVLRIVRDSANKWINAGGSGTAPITGTITSTNPFKTFNTTASSGYFALANVTTAPLPVNWLSFTATQQNNNVDLHWTVSNEINCDHYVVEYSIDGVHFISVATIAAGNISAGTKNYTWRHVPRAAGKHFYRIKQVDRDGRFSYSIIKTAMITLPAAFAVQPNPARDFVIITSPGVITEIRCYNAAGQLVKKAAASSILYKLPVKDLKPGVYSLQVITARQVNVAKILKE
ncbi:MAG: S8 family serine peptidase [Ferruginibacter sp.]